MTGVKVSALTEILDFSPGVVEFLLVLAVVVLCAVSVGTVMVWLELDVFGVLEVVGTSFLPWSTPKIRLHPR